MIELTNITKKYDNKVAFGATQLSFGERVCVGVVGNNGAGKTTMLRLILDLIRPSEGMVTSKGKPVAKSDHWKPYTGSFLDEGFLIPFLKPLEYLRFVGSLSGLSRMDIDEFVAANKPFYEDALFKGKKLIRDLSKGNKNKVGILAAILINPEILILDEPFANLDPGSQSWLMWKLKSLNDSGTTMLISSHDLKQITEIASRVIILEEGRIVEDCQTNDETLINLESYFKISI